MANPINVVNAIITNLSAASVFGTVGAGKDYSVLEQSQGPCAVVSWLRASSNVVSYGAVRERLWTYLAEVYINDTGSASALFDQTATSIQQALASLESDLTLQGTVEAVSQIRAAREPGTALQIGGLTFLTYNIEIDAIQWP